jgi:hypothetical protein
MQYVVPRDSFLSLMVFLLLNNFCSSCSIIYDKISEAHSKYMQFLPPENTSHFVYDIRGSDGGDYQKYCLL